MLQRGIVEGASATVFDPGVPVTRDQLEQLIRGTCALEGSSLKDDVYAAVNREHITTATLYPGYGRLVSASNMSIQVNTDMRNIIGEIARTGGTTERAEGRRSVQQHPGLGQRQRRRHRAHPALFGRH